MIDNLTGSIRHYKQKARTLREYAKPFSEAKVGEATKKYIERCLERAEYNEQLAEWLTELQERREADRWIPVSERLPEESDFYLVTIADNYTTRVNPHTTYVTTLFFMKSTADMWEHDRRVIAWKPLPKPYESEAKNEQT